MKLLIENLFWIIIIIFGSIYLIFLEANMCSLNHSFCLDKAIFLFDASDKLKNKRDR